MLVLYECMVMQAMEASSLCKRKGKRVNKMRELRQTTLQFVPVFASLPLHCTLSSSSLSVFVSFHRQEGQACEARPLAASRDSFHELMTMLTLSSFICLFVWRKFCGS